MTVPDLALAGGHVSLTDIRGREDDAGEGYLVFDRGGLLPHQFTPDLLPWTYRHEHLRPGRRASAGFLARLRADPSGG